MGSGGLSRSQADPCVGHPDVGLIDYLDVGEYVVNSAGIAPSIPSFSHLPAASMHLEDRVR
jgi:hypothetical protein